MATTFLQDHHDRQAKRIHIALAREVGKPPIASCQINERRERKMASLKLHIQRLREDPDLGRLCVASILSEQVSTIMGAYRK